MDQSAITLHWNVKQVSKSVVESRRLTHLPHVGLPLGVAVVHVITGVAEDLRGALVTAYHGRRAAAGAAATQVTVLAVAAPT